MVDDEDTRFGPHTTEVDNLLNWIVGGELLRFGKPLAGPFIPIFDFSEALTLARRVPGRIDWTELRENAESALYEVGLLDTPPWLLYKAEIDNLVSLIADRVAAVLPGNYPGILDDVAADLYSCALCLAVHGKFDSFHERLWGAYACGGWPCGCTGEEPKPPDYELELNTRQFYVFWNPSN
jgi:hypothetical protein